MIGKVNKIGSYNGNLNVKVNLRPNGKCPTPDTFLPNGIFWFAYWNDVSFRTNCCGQSMIEAM